MVGMTYMSGGKSARNAESVANRTCAYGGSCGGNKKPGIITYGGTWPRGNMGNFLVRAPQGCCRNNNSILFGQVFTTRNPVQYTRARAGIVHGLSGLG
uniref:Uncharacterized protein n=1 Tax=viral metagenome TaxID=1070528 RepID=A0A6C0LCV8_9ZZZZ